MTQIRTIKKYPNRRLYDTAESRYITLSDIRQLVLADVPFSVQDQKSGEDITRTILLQVISEQEACGDPVLTRDFLAEMIRTYDRDAPGLVGTFLEQSLQLFARQQEELQTRFAGLREAQRAGPMRDLADRNWTRWVALQRNVYSVLLDQCAATGESRAKDGAAAEPAPDEGVGAAVRDPQKEGADRR